jgi:hypothetical protein
MLYLKKNVWACSLLVWIAAAMGACSEQMPEGLLPPERMQQILLDVSLAETWSSMAAADSAHAGQQKAYDSLSVYYTDIFNHYRLSPEDFEANLRWYAAHPQELDSIYARLLPELSRLEGLHPVQ